MDEQTLNDQLEYQQQRELADLDLILNKIKKVFSTPLEPMLDYEEVE